MLLKFPFKALLTILFVISSFPAFSEADQAAGKYSWMLNAREHIRRNREQKADLEACVAKLGLVKSVTITPAGNDNVVEIVLENTLDIAITGMLLESDDSRLADAGVGTRSYIEFEPIQPNEVFVMTEKITGVIHIFPSRTLIHYDAVDVVDSKGWQLVRDIFWTRWPLISSEEDLADAKEKLCRVS